VLPLMTIVIDCFGCHFTVFCFFLSVAYTVLAVKNKFFCLYVCLFLASGDSTKTKMGMEAEIVMIRHSSLSLCTVFTNITRRLQQPAAILL
jgi:hypothetical protein